MLEELGNLKNMNELVHLIRILIATLCGYLIGYNREKHIKAAGIKAHMLICIASSLMMLISKYGFIDVMSSGAYSWDVSRVAAGIITGMGILGGIVIVRDRGAAAGINTVAGLWATVGVGMALGAGMYISAIGVVIITMLVQRIPHLATEIHDND
ncbi:MAG: MgtC/SapB family protein [Lachnospiraceae bacterium]|nr:MgtC/SapB family protein [Lachnospiraceae bacterium]